MQRGVQWLYQALFLTLPWTTEWPLGPVGTIDLPAEPLLGILAALVLTEAVKKRVWATQGKGWDKDVRLLLTVSSGWFIWMCLCTVFSTMPIVSAKYTLVAITHGIVFLGGSLLFPVEVRRALPFLLWAFVGVVCYTWGHWSVYGFRADQALLAPMPFFPEHNVYAAALVAAFWMGGRMDGRAGWMAVAVLFSTSRAALLSLLITTALPLGGLITRRHRPLGWGILVAFGVLSAGFLCRPVQQYIENDVSLQERLNRYRSALRMAQDRSLWGFGPGTFQFVYHPYQRREEMTRISAERDIGKRSLDTYGRGGGAHSEYFAALAEMGLPGLLLFLLFWVLALRVLLSRVTWPALAVCSLLLHFVLNNFLHDVRIATLFWMALAFGALKKNEPPPLRWPIR